MTTTRTKSTDRPVVSDLEKAAGNPRPSCLGRVSPEAVVLALGSNRGDRIVNLRRAVAGISRFVTIAAMSSVWETAPVDCRDGAGTFLNMVIGGSTRLAPDDLLAAVAEVETRGGRRRRVRNDPRTIDVDILFIGGRSIREPGLVVPHPRFGARNFVLEPLREIARQIPVPAFAGDLSRMRGEGEVRRAGALY